MGKGWPLRLESADGSGCVTLWNVRSGPSGRCRDCLITASLWQQVQKWSILGRKPGFSKITLKAQLSLRWQKCTDYVKGLTLYIIPRENDKVYLLLCLRFSFSVVEPLSKQFCLGHFVTTSPFIDTDSRLKSHLRHPANCWGQLWETLDTHRTWVPRRGGLAWATRHGGCSWPSIWWILAF